MAFEFAGFFGPGLVQDTEGDALPNTNVQVNNPDTTAATLYADRLRATALSNPVTTNSRGQFEFFAEPGFYTITANSVTRTIKVDPDPEESGEEDVLDALAANTQRFMAKLTRNVENVSMVVISDSTANETSDWLYLWAQDFAPKFPAYTVRYNLWNDGTSAYSAAVTLQTGSGSFFLDIWNASVTGKNVLYALAPNFDTMVALKQPDLVVISHGHNEGAAQTPDQWRGPYLALTETVTAACPTAGVLCIAQNPATGTDDQAERAGIYQQVAEMRGFGFVDVHQAFVDTGDPASLTADGVHPNAAGSALWAEVVQRAFVYDSYRAPIRSQVPSSLTTAGEQLLLNGDFAAFTGAVPDSWTKTGGASTTLSKNVTDFESPNGYAVRMQQTAGGGSLRQDLPLKRVLGQYVTLTARLRVPSGQGAEAGRIGFIITDGASTTTVLRPNSNGQGAFRYAVAQIRVPVTATRVQVILYCDSTNAVADVTYDRVVACLGMVPRLAADGAPGPTGPAGPAGGGQLPYLSTMGKEPVLAWLSNTSLAFATANTLVAVPIEPAESMSLAKLVWVTGSISSGNYDIGIYDESGTPLWRKGSAAWPALNTVVEEAVSPAVELAANTRYYVALASDNNLGTYRGSGQSVTDQVRLSDGTKWAFLGTGTQFPLPATLAFGTNPATRLPNVQLRSA